MIMAMNPTVYVSLDEEVDIFDDDSWDFKACESEFNSVYDDNAEFRRNPLAAFKVPLVIGGAIAASFLVAVLGMSLWIRYSALGSEVSAAGKLVTSEGFVACERVEGGVAVNDNDRLVDISKAVSGYFGVLRQENGWSELDDYVENGSHVLSQYKDYLSNMQRNFDVYDCSARLLKHFCQLCTVGKITDILEKDGTYYVYLYIATPTETSAEQFIYMNRYDLTKFTTMENRSMEEYVLDLVNSGVVSCEVAEYCLQFDSNNMLVDDSQILDVCTKAYTNAVVIARKVVGV